MILLYFNLILMWHFCCTILGQEETHTMKTYFYILFLGLGLSATQAFSQDTPIKDNDMKDEIDDIFNYEPTVQIHFNKDGKTFVYGAKGGSAVRGSNVVIIDATLYVKYPDSNPTQYIEFGKVEDEYYHYSWVPEDKIDFTLISDPKTPQKVEHIKFNSSLEDLKPYVKSWKEVWDLEDYDPKLKSSVEEIIKQKDEVSSGPKINPTCNTTQDSMTPEERKELVQSLDTIQNKLRLMNEMYDSLRKVTKELRSLYDDSDYYDAEKGYKSDE